MFKAVNNEKAQVSFLCFRSKLFARHLFPCLDHYSMDFPSNLGLTVGPNIDYVLVKTFNPTRMNRSM